MVKSIILKNKTVSKLYETVFDLCA